MACSARSECRSTALLLCLLLLLIGSPGVSFQIIGAGNNANETTNFQAVRREITEFSKSGPAWDLFVLSLQRFQNAPSNDSLSFFQIAGIHGYPVQPWDNVEGQGLDGFCMHDSVLFPLWHRPYLALYEQVLSNHAKAIALEYPVGRRDQYLAAAKSLRIPYWDWAQTFGLPHIVTIATLAINTPQGIRNVENPLLQYNFPFNMRANGYFPDYGNFASSPHTTRHYNVSTGSNQNAASSDLIARSAARLSNTYELLVSRNRWTEFSAYKLAGVMNKGVNIEGIHGEIHNAVGGLKGGTAFGHMTVTEVSAFDPVFWLHHANVDRLVAIWQALHPNSFVEPTLNADGTFYQLPNAVDSEDTVLAPFHSDTGADMWTAAAVRGIETFGYTYPELVNWNLSMSEVPVTLRYTVNKLYNPLSHMHTNRTRHKRHQWSTTVAQTMSGIYADAVLELGVNNLEVQWYLRLRMDSPIAQIRTSVYLFMGKPLTTASLWYHAPNLIGAFTPPWSIHRSTQAQQVDIPCSHTIAVAVDRGLLPNIDVETVLPFLTANVVAMVVTEAGLKNLSSHFSGLSISVVSRSIKPRRTLFDFPTYDMHREHTHITDITFYEE